MIKLCNAFQKAAPPSSPEKLPHPLALKKFQLYFMEDVTCKRYKQSDLNKTKLGL